MTKTEIFEALKLGNAAFAADQANASDLSQARRTDLASNGQHPIAVVVTCSDSRVAPEHIFSCGLGELFVIRTAGNVIGEFESGSVEYATEHLGVPVIVVLGHTHCGAVGAARGGHSHGGKHGLSAIIGEISAAIAGTTDEASACRANITSSVNRLLENSVIRTLTDAGKLDILKAVYDINSGEVEFFDE